MTSIRNISSILLLLACTSLLSSIALAQSVASPESSVTTELLESRIKETEASNELDDVAKKVMLDLYRKSVSLVEQQRTYEAATQEFAKARESAETVGVAAKAIGTAGS